MAGNKGNSKITYAFTFAACEERVLELVRNINQKTLVEIACSTLLAEWKSMNSQVEAGL
jgi:hypothetical protein